MSFDTLTDPLTLSVAVALITVLLAALTRWGARRFERRLREAADDARDDSPGPMATWGPIAVAAIGLAVGLEVTDALPVAEYARFIESGLYWEIGTLADTTVTPATLIKLVVVFLLGLSMSKLAQRALGSTLKRRGSDQGVIASLQRLVHYAMLLMVLAVGLDLSGFNLRSLLAASAVFAVGISFGLQNIVKNFISGIILLIEQSIKPGDLLTVSDTVVRVQELGIRATRARTLEDDDIIIPNSLLIENNVVNHSLGSERVRARASVGVTYGSDMKKVKEVLDGVAHDFRGHVGPTEPVVLLTGFGDSSVNWEVSVWVKDAFMRQRALSDLRRAIWDALQEAGIVIAFPQLDLHLDDEVVRRLGRAPGSDDADRPQADGEDDPDEADGQRSSSANSA